MTEDTLEDERESELDSISAIFPEISIEGYTATLDIPVVPAEPFSVRFVQAPSIAALQASKNTLKAGGTNSVTLVHGEEQPTRTTHHISHLPPLRMTISLPEGYPTEQPPELDLCTDPSWIPRSVLFRLEREAKALWKEYGYTQIVFAIIDFLQQETERAFGLCEGNDGWATLPPHLELPLLAFDREEKRQTFERETYDCGICLDPKKGSVCYKLRRCGHVYCVPCLRDCYETAITEGDVDRVKCPDPDCGKEALNVAQRRSKKQKTLNPAELLEIPIERPKVQRYVDMKLKKKLESDQTTIYCPRKWCQAPARSAKFAKYKTTDLENISDSESEPEEAEDAQGAADGGQRRPQNHNFSTQAPIIDRLAVCSKCKYAFCRICQKSWHGEFINCLPPLDSKLTKEDKASFDYIRSHTSPCPTCASPCQKTQGCNHMRCYTCKSHFCYLCSAWLMPADPYKHFNTEGEPCYQRLWELEEGDEGQRAHVFAGARAAGMANVAVDAVEQDEELVRQQVAELNVGAPARGLQRFLRMAAAHEEDEWDSDELDDLDGLFFL